jgi:hypothetical protein
VDHGHDHHCRSRDSAPVASVRDCGSTIPPRSRRRRGPRTQHAAVRHRIRRFLLAPRRRPGAPVRRGLGRAVCVRTVRCGPGLPAVRGVSGAKKENSRLYLALQPARDAPHCCSPGMPGARFATPGARHWRCLRHASRQRERSPRTPSHGGRGSVEALEDLLLSTQSAAFREEILNRLRSVQKADAIHKESERDARKFWFAGVSIPMKGGWRRGACCGARAYGCRASHSASTGSDRRAGRCAASGRRFRREP